MKKMDIDDEDLLSYQYSIIAEVIKKIGPRLPGSEEEAKAAKWFKKKFSELTKTEAVAEEFTFAPKASIGFIPILGNFIMFVMFPLYYISALAHFVVGTLAFAFAIAQIFRYTGWFDFLFPKATAQNIYTVLEPPSGKVDFTLVLSGHIDSSWHSPLFAKRPELSRYKIVYGIMSTFLLIVFSLVRTLNQYEVINAKLSWMLYLPIGFFPGFYFLSRYIVYDKEKASPGAMDDLSGIAASMWMIKYWQENPEKRPTNCRIVLLAIGSEEAGLKGSFAFVERHKNDLLSEKNNPWVLILDGLGDKDFVHIINGDDWLGTNYDPILCELADKAMTELKIEHDMIKNPAGGTDAAAYTRAGIRSVCLAAQNPQPGSNYHTKFDTLERIEKEATLWITKAALKLVEKLDLHVHQQ